MPKTPISKQEVRGTASGVLFMAFFGTAWAGIGIGGLQGWGSDWLLPLVLLIGIILLICGVWTHYVTGALLCLLSVVTLLFVPVQIHVGQHQIVAWWSFLGFGSALILWATGVVILFMGRGLLRMAKRA